MSAPSQPVGQTISHYRIISKIGGGGMGVIFEGEDLKLISTYLAIYAPDGKSFLYSLAANGQTTIFRQPLHNGVPAGTPVPALKLPFTLREDYGGNAFAVSRDLSSIVYARPGGYDDLYLLAQK